MQQDNKALFQNYEIKNFNYSPLLYKLLAAAAVFNLLAIFVMGKAELFTTRGCESPMVSRVCQVIDTVYVGGKMLTTDSGYVDKDYIPTDFADADITYIDVSGVTPPLSYPAGYFALANPESQYTTAENPTDFSAVNPSGIPGIPGFPMPNSTVQNPTMDLKAIPQITPTPNKKITTGKIPTSPFGNLDGITVGENPVPNPPLTGNNKPPRPTKWRDNSRNKLKETPNNLTAENKNTEDPTVSKTPEETKSEPVTEVEINKRPIKDLGVFVNALLKDEKAKFNLETQFEATAKGKLTKEGKLDPKKTKIEVKSTDPNMVEVVEQSIEAINDAGYLKYLRDLSGKDLNLLLKQDDAGIAATVESEMESNQRATTMKGLLNLAIKLSKDKKTDPNDKDDLELLNGATVETDGKKLIIKFAIRKEIAQEMIKRKLLEEATKPQTNNTVQSDSLSRQVTK